MLKAVRRNPKVSGVREALTLIEVLESIDRTFLTLVA